MDPRSRRTSPSLFFFVGPMAGSPRTLVSKWPATAVRKVPTFNPICVDRRSGCKAGFKIELLAAEFIFASLSRPTPAKSPCDERAAGSNPSQAVSKVPEAAPGAALFRRHARNFVAVWPLPRGIALGGDVG